MATVFGRTRADLFVATRARFVYDNLGGNLEPVRGGNRHISSIFAAHIVAGRLPMAGFFARDLGRAMMTGCGTGGVSVVGTPEKRR